MSMLSKLNKELNRQLDQPAEPHRLRWWHIPLLLLLIAGTIYVVMQNKGGKPSADSNEAVAYQRCEGGIFGTFYHITYQYPTDLHDSIKQVMHEVDNSLSPFNPNSVISAINNNTAYTTDDHFLHVFNLAKHISAETDGAFDITVAPLVNAWGFGFKNKEQITDELIDSLLPLVGMDKVWLDDTLLCKADTSIMLDCSAIAKGYGVDAVAQMLEMKGVVNYMVEIGGELRVSGLNPKNRQWNIGVVKPDPDPSGQNNELEEVLSLTDIAMATSGNYRNFYEEGNQRYAHTIDPRTGRPVQHNILSSTVLAADCATADAYATAFMVLGLEGAKAVLEQHPELKVYFIYSDSDGRNAVWRKGI